MLLWLALACKPAPEAVATGIGSQNPAVREDMVAFAATYDDPVVVEALHRALNDPSSRVRREAAQSLGAIQAPESVQPLIAALNDLDPEVQEAAADALGRLGDPSATEAVLAYLQAKLGERVPLTAIWALGRFGDPRALPLLSELRDHSDPYVAWNALEALRAIGDGSADGAPAAGSAAAPAPGAAPEPAGGEQAPAPEGAIPWPGQEPEEVEDAGDGDLAPEEPTGAVPDEAPPPITVPWPGG